MKFSLPFILFLVAIAAVVILLSVANNGSKPASITRKDVRVPPPRAANIQELRKAALAVRQDADRAKQHFDQNATDLTAFRNYNDLERLAEFFEKTVRNQTK